MEDDVDHIADEHQFWEEVEDIASTPCRSHDRIDDTLRTWLSIITRYRDQYAQSEQDISTCSRLLIDGSLVNQHADYVRRQLVYALLQEDDPTSLHLITTFLLHDGRQHDTCLELLSEEGAFPRLVDLIRRGTDDDHGLHRRMLVLLYEMSRIQRMSWNDLIVVDDAFVLYLFQIIESLSSDVNDPYHYPTIRVLLVLNEQYMVCTHDSSDSISNGQTMTNRVIKILSTYGGTYKTFGENIILLLNRERKSNETALQLLILKLFYLLFTTSSTYEYFYTNDLHVLVDILIRNLLDLPPDDTLPSSPVGGSSIGGAASATTTTSSLRHTYLRVLYPLLSHTQLTQAPHYKRNDLRKLLFLLADVGHTHFARPDATTIRLVGRCLNVHWLRDSEDEAEPLSRSQTLSPDSSLLLSPIEAGQATVAKKLIGMSLPEAQESALSVNEVAKQQAKPGEATPSRKREQEEGSALARSESWAETDVDVLSPISEGDPFGG